MLVLVGLQVVLSFFLSFFFLLSPGRSFLRHIEVTFNPPTFCGFSSERERAATSGSHGCGGSGGGGGGEVRCCCWWW